MASLFKSFSEFRLFRSIEVVNLFEAKWLEGNDKVGDSTCGCGFRLVRSGCRARWLD